MKVSSFSPSAPAETPFSLLVATLSPWMRHHQPVLDTFKASATFDPAICVIWPPPYQLLHGPNRRDIFPHFEDLVTLLRRLEHEFRVFVCHMRASDLTKDAQALFRLLPAADRMRELWLSPGQSIGRGPAGSFDGLTESLRHTHCVVRILPKAEISCHRIEIFNALKSGRMKDVHRMVGLSPSFIQSSSKSLHAWPNGRYYGTYDGIELEFSVHDHRADFVGWLTVPRVDVVHGPGDLVRSA